jgi:hypothetical protein
MRRTLRTLRCRSSRSHPDRLCVAEAVEIRFQLHAPPVIPISQHLQLISNPCNLLLLFLSADRPQIAQRIDCIAPIEVGKGEESFLSLPVVARGSIPPIYRRALFGHRATPWSVPRTRRQVGSTAGGTRTSDKKIKPRRRKCVHRSRRLSVCHFRLNFMARIRIRNQPSKARNRLRQRENEVAK